VRHQEFLGSAVVLGAAIITSDNCRHWGANSIAPSTYLFGSSRVTQREPCHSTYEPLGCSFGVCVVGAFKIKTARNVSIRTDHIGSVVYSYYSYTAFLFLVLFMSSQDFQNPRELFSEHYDLAQKIGFV
jgi:hypothetical protein